MALLTLLKTMPSATRWNSMTKFHAPSLKYEHFNFHQPHTRTLLLGLSIISGLSSTDSYYPRKLIRHTNGQIYKVLPGRFMEL